MLDADFLEWMTSGDSVLAADWESWLQTNPHKRGEVERAVRLFQLLKFRQTELSLEVIDEEWEKLEEFLDKTPEFSTHRSFDYEEYLSPVWRRAGFAAAVLALMIIGGVAYFKMPQSSHTQWVEYTAPRGRKVSLKLEDGSRILLNAGSKITYPRKFKPGKRELSLNGEAFFEVVRDTTSPFFVTAGSVTTQVLGTSFGITAYPNQQVGVAVVTGKVKVFENETPHEQIYLSPSQMATFEDSSRVFKIRNFDQNKLLAWVSGVLYFDKADFGQVKTKLENWYGVTLKIEPGLTFDENLLLTGKYQNKSIEYVLDAYRYPERFRYRIKNDTVTIFH